MFSEIIGPRPKRKNLIMCLKQLIFLSGGAGVGKTRVTKAMNQALIRLYNTSPDSPPEQILVLLAAPTGKAAYLIKGQTIHSAFGIPANQGLSYCFH